MANAVLTALLSNSQIQSVTTGATTQDATQVPAALSRLPVGTVLKGFVVNRDNQNTPILRTQQGDVRVHSDVFLKTGSDVAIRIEQQGAQLRARIIRVDNVPVKEYISQQATAPGSDEVLQSSLAPRSGTPVNPAATSSSVATLNALLLKPAGNPAQAADLISAVLRVPQGAAQAIAQGVPIQFKVISADFRVAAAPTAGANAPAGAAVSPSAPGAGVSIGSGAPAPPAATAAPPPPPSQPPASPTSPAPDPANIPGSAATGLASAAYTRFSAAAYGAYGALPAAPPTAPGGSAPGLTAQPSTPTTSASGAAKSATPSTPASSSGPPGQLFTGKTSTRAAVPATPPATTPADPSAAAPNRADPAPAGAREAVPAYQVQRGNTISARVIGNEPGGETVVRTSVGTFKLFTAAPPPAGSLLQLELVFTPSISQSVQARPEATQTSLATQFLSLSHDWQSLEETQNVLRTQPNAFVEMSQRIPNTKSELVNQTLFFLSALRSGDIRQWLGGRAIQQLEARSPNLLQRLSADFANLRNISFEQPDYPWQVFLLPLRHDDELNPLRLFVKQDEHHQQDQSGAGGTRFVFDLTLSELGDMQLDGFFRKHDRQMQFDLVIRSERPLPEPVSSQITHIYQEGAQTVGYHGQIYFEPHKKHFVMPLNNTTNEPSGDGHSILA